MWLLALGPGETSLALSAQSEYEPGINHCHVSKRRHLAMRSTTDYQFAQPVIRRATDLRIRSQHVNRSDQPLHPGLDMRGFFARKMIENAIEVMRHFWRQRHTRHSCQASLRAAGYAAGWPETFRSRWRCISAHGMVLPDSTIRA